MEVNLDYSSDDVETENVSFNDHAGGYLGEELHRADVGAMSIAAAAELLRHEYIPVVDIPRPGIYEVRLRSGELSRYEGLSDAREYLRIVVEQARAADSVRLPRVPLGYPTTTRGDVYIDNYNHYGGNNAIQSQVGSQHSVPDPPSSRRLRDEET